MVKHRTRRTRRGGAWYDPRTWFSSSTEPSPVPETPAPTPVTPAPAVAPYGGKKKSKTRRGGRRHHKSRKTYFGY